MQKLLTASILALAAATAQADPALMFGINYNFGSGGPGLSVKVLSSDHEDRTVASVGASRAMSSRTCSICGLAPTMFASVPGTPTARRRPAPLVEARA